MSVLEYEFESWEAWLSADSTANALIEDAWELAPDAEGTASAAWDTALAALEAVDSTAPASLTAFHSGSFRYPSTEIALEAVQEAARASAAAFVGVVAVGCPRGPLRAALSALMTESGSSIEGCEVWAWAVAAEAEATAAYEAMWRAGELAALADSMVAMVDAGDAWAARAAAGDLTISTFVAAIEAGVATRSARDLVTQLSLSGCGGG